MAEQEQAEQIRKNNEIRDGAQKRILDVVNENIRRGVRKDFGLATTHKESK